MGQRLEGGVSMNGANVEGGRATFVRVVSGVLIAWCSLMAVSAFERM